jgi:hypothetical protein
MIEPEIIRGDLIRQARRSWIWLDDTTAGNHNFLGITTRDLHCRYGVMGRVYRMHWGMNIREDGCSLGMSHYLYLPHILEMGGKTGRKLKI